MSKAQSSESGIVVVDKAPGWTSHQVVGRVRRLAGTRKVGHAGTLDPMATGVLLVGINRATRLLGHLMLTEKEYRGTVRLGLATITDDAEGDVTAAPGATGIDPARLDAEMAHLTGEIDQVPTRVSAIKVNGVRSYARVRAGEDVELAARRVRVSRFEATDVRTGNQDGVAVVDVDVSVTCSSGTYVRALARDLGAALGTAGHLTMLRRTRVGPYGLDGEVRVQDAVQGAGQVQSAVQLEGAVEGESPPLAMISIDDVARDNFPTVVVDDDTAAAVRHGRRIGGLDLSELTAVLDEQQRFLALYRPDAAEPPAPGVVAEAVFRPA
ncbi:MAG: tRNA pseudouridine(55) synthase TruB [Propionibacteriaceae bacterium]